MDQLGYRTWDEAMYRVDEPIGARQSPWVRLSSNASAISHGVRSVVVV